jgi:hypothetical protein
VMLRSSAAAQRSNLRYAGRFEGASVELPLSEALAWCGWRLLHHREFGALTLAACSLSRSNPV